MSSSILPFIQVQITRYGIYALMILCNIGNIFTVVLFYRRRQNACAMYLLCAATINSVALTFNGIINVYSLDYGDPSVYSLFFCKFRYYFGHMASQIGRYLAIVACIDRYLWTTNYAHARFLNRPAMPRYIIGIVVLFWLIIPIHIPLFITVNNGACGPFGVYYIIYQVYSTISLGLLPPILMGIFACLAYHNMRNLHARVRPLGVNDGNNNNNISIHRRDRELLVMVLTEVAVYVITSFPYPFILLEIAVTAYMGINKSNERRQIESFLSSISVLLASSCYGSSFYIYLAVSKPFRKDFRELFIKTRRIVVEGLNTNRML
jgi:hypothetical protein